MKKLFYIIMLFVPTIAVAQIQNDIDTLFNGYRYEYLYGSIPRAEKKAYNLIQVNTALGNLIYSVGVGDGTAASAALADLNLLLGKSYSMPLFNFDQTAQSYIVVDSINVGGLGYVDSLISWAGVISAIEAYNILTSSDSTWVKNQISDSVQAAIATANAYTDAVVISEVVGDSTWVSITTGTVNFDANNSIYLGNNVVRTKSAGVESFTVSGYGFGSVLSSGAFFFNPSVTDIRLAPNQSDDNTGISWVSEDNMALRAGGLYVANFKEIGDVGILDVNDSMAVAGGAAFLGSVYMPNLVGEFGGERWLGLNVDGVFSDSISTAGYGLSDDLPNIHKYLGDVVGGEVYWVHIGHGGELVKDYSTTKNLREKIQQLQWGIEHSYRYIAELDKMVHTLKFLVYVLFCAVILLVGACSALYFRDR